MHHAFPRECPFPAETDSTPARMPEEWAKEEGSSDFSKEEMEQYIKADDSCPLSDLDDPASHLPWSSTEKLISSNKAVSTQAGLAEADMVARVGLADADMRELLGDLSREDP